MVTYPDPRTVTASEVLAGLRGIVEREQLDHAGYVSHEIDRELAESGALCRGHRACAVGATWLAGGIEPTAHMFKFGTVQHVEFSMPGTGKDHNDRLAWLRDEGYHGLRTAYKALCAAAQEHMDQRGLEIDSDNWGTAGALEGLFESSNPSEDGEDDGYLIEPRDMLVVIDRAEELIA